jgi:hypothetical protein
MIARHIGDINILVVDHHAKNSNDFYQNHLIFINNTIIQGSTYNACENIDVYQDNQVEMAGNCCFDNDYQSNDYQSLSMKE